MDFREYARRAGETEQHSGDHGLQIALYGVAGEAASVVGEAKKWLREERRTSSLAGRVEEEVGDLLWYIATVCNHLDLDLDEVATRNLAKTRQIWTSQLSLDSAYDTGFPAEQQLLRSMRVRFVEDRSGPFPTVRMEPLGPLEKRVLQTRAAKGLGDPLDDNSRIDDGYRFHDVIHLAHAAVLGWSPVLRALMGAKRKDNEERDRVDDGARAIAIEEGLAALVFNYLEPDGFLEYEDHLPWDLSKHIIRTVRGLEVADKTVGAWTRTYKAAFDVFRKLTENGGGVVEADLDAQQLRYLGPDGQVLGNSSS